MITMSIEMTNNTVASSVHIKISEERADPEREREAFTRMLI